MKSNFINETHIEGILYDQKLEKKTTGENSKHPGTEFISGTVSIATDDKLENVIQIHYTYITAVTSKGNADARFTTLEKIMTENQSVLNVGKEKAIKVRCDSTIDVNEWYRELTDEKPASVVRNEGGFIHIVNAINEDEKLRNTFKADMVITRVRDVEGNPERNIPESVHVNGCVFNFRKEIRPVEFVVKNKGGMDYFRGLEPTPKTPVFTCVWGRQLSQTIVTRTVTESAFGEDEVRERNSSVREFVITGCNRETYEWDDEATITAAELSKAMSDRELYLASIKKRQEEYQASRSGSSAAAVSNETSGYDF